MVLANVVANVPRDSIRQPRGGVKEDRGPAKAAAAFLRGIWHWGKGTSWERHFLRGPAGDWGLRCEDLEDLERTVLEVKGETGNWLYSPHAYLPRGGRTVENIVQVNAVVIDLDDGDLEEAETRLRERGLKPHYVVHTSPGHYQLIFLQEPLRLGKRNRERILRRQQEVILKLYKLVGGDLEAAKVNQLFRLPGSRRQLPDGVWTVRIVEQSDHPPYSLNRLERAVAGTHKRLRSRTFRGYRPAENRRENKNDRRVLNSPALQWLQSHTIATGFRNMSLVSMCYAAAMDGFSYDEARPMLLRWVEEHTDGPYPHREAEAVIRSCYANPKGLNPKILARIQDVNGETMTEEQAKSVLKFMPRTRQVHQRLPLEELRNRPLFESLMRVLKALAELQLKRSDRRPVKITTAELAERADVPPGTLWMRVIPILDKLKIRRVERQGKTPISTYDLRKLSPTFYIPYAFIDSKLFKRSPAKVVAYWAWRFKELWRAFLALLKRLIAIFTDYVVEPPAFYKVNEGSHRPRPREARGPPRRVTDVGNEAVFWSTLGGLSPVLPKHRARELERIQRVNDLLREWRNLSDEEKARRREARLAVARRWALEGG